MAPIHDVYRHLRQVAVATALFTIVMGCAHPTTMAVQSTPRTTTFRNTGVGEVRSALMEILRNAGYGIRKSDSTTGTIIASQDDPVDATLRFGDIADGIGDVLTTTARHTSRRAARASDTAPTRTPRRASVRTSLGITIIPTDSTVDVTVEALRADVFDDATTAIPQPVTDPVLCDTLFANLHKMVASRNATNR